MLATLSAAVPAQAARRGVQRDVQLLHGSRRPGLRGPGRCGPGRRHRVVVRAGRGGLAAVGPGGYGLCGTARGVRRDAAARAGSPRGGRPRPHGRRRAHPRQRPGPRADRADQDRAELLAGDRDRGCRAVAASPDERGRGHPPGHRQGVQSRPRPRSPSRPQARVPEGAAPVWPGQPGAVQARRRRGWSR